MTTLEVFAGTSDGFIISSHSSYATARAGGTLAAYNSAYLAVGQFGDAFFEVHEGFLQFAVPELPAGSVIDSAVLSLYGHEDYSEVDFTLQAREYDWGATFDSSDWVPGGNLSALTLLASRSTSGWSISDYNALTSEAALVSAITPGSPLRIILCSSRTVSATQPTTLGEHVRIKSADTAGTGQDPKLVITYHTDHSLQGSFTGVATLEGAMGQSYALGATFQGVAGLSSILDRIPAGGLESFDEADLDFTVYDGYVQSEDNPLALGLIYHEDEGTSPSTVSRRLEPERQDVGQNPFENRPEAGNIFSQGDFSHGAGQTYFHVEGRDDKRYYWSDGFDISDPGILRHLHDTAAIDYNSGGADTGARFLAQFNSLVFVSDGDKVYRSSDLASWTVEDPGGATNATIEGLVSSGQHLYAACGADGIYRRTTAGAWSQFSTVAATRIAWVKGRIVATDGDEIFELVTGIESALEALPAGWTFTSIFEVGQFIYATAAATADGVSEIRHYGLDNTQALVVLGSTPMPRGQLAVGGVGYLNAAYIGVGEANAGGGYDPSVYQGFPDNDSGFLSLVKLAEGEGSGATDLGVRAFEPIGETVLMGWSLGSSSPFGVRVGLAAHDLAKDAFSGHLKAAGTAAQILSILTFKGVTLFTANGIGLFKEDTTKFVATARLYSSVADWSSAAPKSWDLMEVAHNALPAGTEVDLDYTSELPEDNSYVPALVSNVANSDGASASLGNKEFRLFAVRVTSKAKSDQSAAPEVASFSTRSFPMLVNPEFTLTRYVRLLDADRKDTRGEAVYQDPLAVRRVLQMLAYRRVRLYEPGVTWTARLETVADVRPFLPHYSATEGEADKDMFVVQLVLTGTRD